MPARPKPGVTTAPPPEDDPQNDGHDFPDHVVAGRYGAPRNERGTPGRRARASRTPACETRIGAISNQQEKYAANIGEAAIRSPSRSSCSRAGQQTVMLK